MTTPETHDLSGKVALVTGGANGLGLATARALARAGARLVIADVDEAAGQTVADELGGPFVRTDVRDLQQNIAAVAVAEEAHGGLDLVFLNAGVPTGTTVGDDFDIEAYRRAMGVNLDGVVFGVQAALPALRRRDGGAIVATASMAGLTGIATDPIYGANKHAVVGLVRSLAPSLSRESIRVNALCPSFADTAIISDFRATLVESGVPIIDPETVADAAMALFSGLMTGECWYVQAGRPAEAFQFRGIPGPRGGPSVGQDG